MFRWIFLLAVVCAAWLATPPVAAHAEMDLESLIEEALANNPNLDLLHLRWSAAAAR